MTVVELLRDLVRIPSESRNEGALVDYLEKLFTGFGWKPVRSGNNLHAILGSDGPLLLLNSHTDTVPVGEGWTQPALEAKVVGGKIYGRGANDAKGPLAAMIMAVKGSKVKGRLCLAATCEEEVFGQGLEKLITELPKPDAAVVGEPTGLAPAVAQKGLLLLEVTAKGRSAHAAWGGGINAIELAAKDVAALSALKLEREHPALGLTSLRVTQIEGGTRHNVIPDRCKMVLDIRTTPSYSVDELIDLVKKTAAGEVTVRSKRFGAVETDLKEPVVKAALAANPGGKPYGSPTLSDWVNLKGVPTVKVGPGESKRSHTPDEYIETAELEAGVEFYKRLIKEYLS